jgi:hypothetical protein
MGMPHGLACLMKRRNPSCSGIVALNSIGIEISPSAPWSRTYVSRSACSHVVCPHVLSFRPSSSNPRLPNGSVRSGRYRDVVVVTRMLRGRYKARYMGVTRHVTWALQSMLHEHYKACYMGFTSLYTRSHLYPYKVATRLGRFLQLPAAANCLSSWMLASKTQAETRDAGPTFLQSTGKLAHIKCFGLQQPAY